MRFVRSVVVLSMVAACSEPPRPEQASLDTAHAKWAADEPDRYTFFWSEACLCTPDVVRKIRIVVMDDMITAASYTDNSSPVGTAVRMNLLTIEGVFDRLQEAIDEGADSVSALYDPRRGNPTQIAVDYDQHQADEEWSLVISNVLLD